MATSEQEIVVNSDLCPGLSDDYMSQIRSDFTVCALPADSLTGTCISGADNEPDECGYGPNVMGLCGYCAGSSSNSTDSCCTNANAASRCKDVTVPTTTASLPPLMPSSSSNSTGNAADSHHGLSGGQIAGAVVGSVAGFAILVALIVFALVCLRRRRRAESDTALNQPNPQRRGFAPMQNPSDNPGMVMIPGGRVARMSALREMPSLTSRRSRRTFFGGSSTKYTTEPSESEAPSASPGRMSRQIPPLPVSDLAHLRAARFWQLQVAMRLLVPEQNSPLPRHQANLSRCCLSKIITRRMISTLVTGSLFSGRISHAQAMSSLWTVGKY